MYLRQLPIFLINMALFLQSNACQKSEQAVTIDGDATMNVTIYIESMCKASRVFIQTQLKPIYEDIKDKVNLRFVTFALSESGVDENDVVTLKCFHGPRECEVDFFQTCALHVYRHDKYMQAAIILCTMQPKIYYMVCVEELQLDISKIDSCRNGNLGTYLAMKSQQEALNVVLLTSGVPSVTFNNLIDPAASIKSTYDLKSTIEERIEWFKLNFGNGN